MGSHSPAHAQSAENVAVVINENSALSMLIGDYYIRKRSIPASNVIRIRTRTDETIEREIYAISVEGPIAAAITREGLQDRILYLLLTKGVPLRIAGTAGLQGTLASVDSELTLLYRRITGRAVPIIGPVENPYFLADREASTAKRFSHREQDIYLVSRIDAFTADEATALVDAGLAPGRDGRIVLDERAGLVNSAPDALLARAAERLAAMGQGDRVVLETTPKPAAESAPAIGYYSWGGTDPQLRSRNVGLTFAPGALASTFAGTDARTFEPPPPGWQPMVRPQDRTTWFGGQPQSLTGDLIRAGVTGVAGHIADPLVGGAIRPDILFPAYLSGFSMVEAFYLAMPYLSWQTVVVGDPLCNPFAQRLLTRDEIEPPVDRRTELPAFYSARRLTEAGAGLKTEPRVTEFMVHADTLLRRGDRAGARKAFEEAIAAAPTLVPALLQLAFLDEQANDHDTAIVRYRRILEIQPGNAIVLNNLAYSLAVRKGSPMDAKPLAEQAVTLSNRTPNAVDTLGWIEHLLGNEQAAATLIDEAARKAPGSAEIRFHAAAIAVEEGNRAKADMHLREVLRIDPAWGEREEVVALRKRIDALPQR